MLNPIGTIPQTRRWKHSVVWSVTTLRPYIEGLPFTVRTDHDSFRLLMNISDSTGWLMRWRLRLSEFDFTVKYRPGLVHQVPDALSRVLTSDGNDKKPTEDEWQCRLDIRCTSPPHERQICRSAVQRYVLSNDTHQAISKSRYKILRGKRWSSSTTASN